MAAFKNARIVLKPPWIDGKCVSTDEWCLKSYLSKFVRWTMININLKATSADGSFSRKGPFFSTSKEPPSFAIINFSNLLVVCSTHQQSSVLYHLKSCILHFSKQQEYWVVRKEGVRLSKTNTSVEMYSSVPKKGFDRSMNHLFLGGSGRSTHVRLMPKSSVDEVPIFQNPTGVKTEEVPTFRTKVLLALPLLPDSVFRSIHLYKIAKSFLLTRFFNGTFFFLQDLLIRSFYWEL